MPPPPPEPAAAATGGATAAVVPAPAFDAAVPAPAGAAASLRSRWPMPNPAATGLPHAARYQPGGKGVVVDQVTGLAWQVTPEARGGLWAQARARCQTLRLGGAADWRLPTRVELVSLVDMTRRKPAIDTRAFPAAPPEWFWTSSVGAANPDGAAWAVSFESGAVATAPTNTDYRIRCVRVAVPAAAAPVSGAAGSSADTIRDPGADLTWQLRPAPQALTFAAAQKACLTLRLGNEAGGPWRLPSPGELQSIIDEGAYNPAVDGNAFPGTPAQPFWTSSSIVGEPGKAWAISFGHGNTLDLPITATAYTRCVR